MAFYFKLYALFLTFKVLKSTLAMKYRRFGRTNWNVSEIGYGMWGLAGWKGSVPQEIDNSLSRSVELGCNFFDTAWAYDTGEVSEKPMYYFSFGLDF